jgi:hypothetical protein
MLGGVQGSGFWTSQNDDEVVIQRYLSGAFGDDEREEVINSMKDKTVIGIFRDRDDAEDAINVFENAGLQAKDISIIMQDRAEAESLASDTGTSVAGSALTGATTGGVLGGIAGLLIGVGAITIPGLGPLLIGGPLATALGLTGAAATTASGAATGAVAGGLLGALVGLGLPSDEARIYEDEIREGGILVAVAADLDDEDDIREVFVAHNGQQIRTITHTHEVVDDIDRRSYRARSSSFNMFGAKGGRSRKARLSRRVR